MKRKISIVLSIILILVLTITGCSSQTNTKNTDSSNESTKKVVRIAFVSQNDTLSDYGTGGIAQQKKYFEEEFKKIGYEPEYVPFSGGGPAINEAIVAKKLDFAIYGDLPSIVLKSKGIGVSLIGITNNSLNLDLIVSKNSSINSVQDIKGKKIIVTKGTIVQNYFQHLIDANNINISDVDVVNAGGDSVSTFLSGSVDGLGTTDIQAQKLVQDGSAKIIHSTVDKLDWSSQNVVLSRDDFAKDNPDAPVALLKALIRGKNLIKDTSDKNEIYKFFDTGLGEAPTKKAFGFDGEKFDFASVEINSNSVNKLKDLNKFLLDQKLINNSVDIDKYVNTTYYDKAIKELK
ncbi:MULTISPECIES: ABC transporter substrate-binding protein [Clostridium]|uniref:ABC transporter substrate-binding protein n=1 Tax=Clostridium TaxID=1485 RepID=UPI00156E3BAF|nr:ABC transporter substrate-binding protein [Clostridium beijerinckii]NRT71444.1 sulfonate transport system substrate-binding protein [Clostridium beijerinckii]